MNVPKKIAFAVITNVALVLAAEWSLQWLGAGNPSTGDSPVEFVGNDAGGRFPTALDPMLFWSIPPHASIPDLQPCLEEKVNSEGFRGGDFSLQKPPGTRRLLLLGDSNTFGMGVEGDEPYFHRIGRWLETSKDSKWEVINSAVPGYSSFQMLQMLRTRGVRYSPDVIVVYAGAWNDYTPAIGTNDEDSFRAFRESFSRNSRTGGLFGDLRLFRFMARLATSRPDHPADVQRARSKQEEYRRLWSDRMERPDGPRLQPAQFQRILTTIAHDGKQLGAKVIFIVPPAPWSTRTRFKDGDLYAQIVRDLAMAEADGMVDARAALWTESKDSDSKYFCDIIHPNPDGHALVAQRLAAELQRLGIPGVPSGGTDGIVNEPLRLKGMQESAQHFTGDPPREVSAADAAKLDSNLIVLPSPGKIIFKNLALPANPSMRCELTFFTRDNLKQMAPSFVPKLEEHVQVTFRVHAGAPGTPGKVVFENMKDATNASAWAGPYLHRIDLGEFGGRTVDLTLETTGVAKFAAWGQARIYPYR